MDTKIERVIERVMWVLAPEDVIWAAVR